MSGKEALMQRYLDGQATAEEISVLNEELRRSPEARQRFLDLTNLDSALAAQAAGWEAP